MRHLHDWTLKSADGRQFQVSLREGDSLSLGRDLTCDVSLLDAGVSRHHATLSVENGELWIEDIHSQNGTFVNSERTTRQVLRAGDAITLGRVHLTVREAETVEELEAAAAAAAAESHDTARVENAPLFPGPPRWSSRRHVTPDEGTRCDPTGERPTRLLTLLEGQLGRVRRHLVDGDRLDTASHDDLAELSVAMRALTVILGAETSSPRRIDLSSTVRQIVACSTLAIEPSAIEAEAPIEVVAPPESVGLAIELLLSSARRLATDIVLRVSTLPGSSTARIRLEAHPCTDAAERIDWNDQDVGLVIARHLVETLQNAKLRVDPGAGHLDLEIALVTTVSRSPHAELT